MVLINICPECRHYMYGSIDEEDSGGDWIMYECRNDNCRFRVKEYEERELTYYPVDYSEISNYSYEIN